MKPLTVNPDYLSLVPRLSKEEYASLERDIISSGGAFEPISINKKDEILDGHTRFEICNSHGLYYNTKVIDLPTIIDEKIYIIKSNLIRRQLTDYEKVEMAKPLENLIAEKARLQQGTRTDLTSASNEAKVDSIVTNREVAKAIGVSKATYERAKKIRDEGTEDEKAKARNKRRSINSAYRDTQIRLRREELKDKGVPPLPEGQFDTILADPPWDYDVSLHGTPETHYTTMKTPDICALKIPSSDNSILFLWATNPKLTEALEVLKAWGFTYKTNMVWVKDWIGVGFYVRGQHELILIGVKGDAHPPPEDSRPSSVLNAPRRQHSEKPDEIYPLIEKMYPEHKFLELFARETRPGWASWGAEL